MQKSFDLHLSRKSPLYKAASLVGWVGQSLDIQVTTQFSEIENNCLCLANLYKTRNVALETIQSPPSLINPQISPFHLKMLVDIGISETELYCT